VWVAVSAIRRNNTSFRNEKGAGMKLRVGLNVKFLVMLLAVPMLRAQEVLAPETRRVVTLPELLAETSRVHPAIKAEAQLIVSPKTRVPQIKALPEPAVGGNGMQKVQAVLRLESPSV
jgi:hypothetical protein